MNLDFLNLNSKRAYPFKEGVTRVSTDALSAIPDDFCVDLILTMGADVTTKFFVNEIRNLPEQITLKLADSLGSLAGTFTINTVGHKLYQEYYLVPSATYAGSQGKLVVAYLTSMQKLPTGTFRFNLANTEFESRVVIPSPAGISRFVFKDDTDTEFSVTGNVGIYGRSNLRFRLVDNKVYMDAGNGLGLNQDCTAEGFPIRTINSIQPDSAGNFKLSFTGCTTFSAIPNGLNLDDSCNKPCMGCNEIGELTERLMQLETTLLQLRQYYNQLNILNTQLNNVINFNCEVP